MKVPFLNLKWQHDHIAGSLEKRLNTIFENTSFTFGPDVALFEENFANYLGVNHFVGVDNGTDALTIAYAALGLREGDEFITIPTTYIATVSAGMHIGLKPVFVDIDPATRNIDLKKLERALTPRTKAIVAVHLYGDAAPMDEIISFARAHNLLVIEDAAQAHGTRYKGKRVGSFGDISTFSFYPGKNLGAYGQGGGIATNDNVVREKLLMLRSQGEAKKYDHQVIGWNSRLDTMQAAVLDEKLKKLDAWNDVRRVVAKIYDKELPEKFVRIPPRNADTEHVYHLYIIELLEKKRDDLREFLKQHSIESGIHYPVPLHLTPALQGLGYKKGDFPVAEEFAERIISLPMFPGESEEEAHHVTKVVSDFFHA